ncbi:MAG: hypothetical protein IPO27_11750 [Bacteroidetes bacterium]|nr:hypothetical protein [Bacteroidota bacterium]
MKNLSFIRALNIILVVALTITLSSLMLKASYETWVPCDLPEKASIKEVINCDQGKGLPLVVIIKNLKGESVHKASLEDGSFSLDVAEPGTYIMYFYKGNKVFYKSGIEIVAP